ncbi:MAG: hypothetical protein HXM02_07320 [[Eubacterium] sulci]|nr:hypothetical protein [[Eubacterium] sulci]
MKDFNLKSLSIKDMRDVGKFFDMMEYGLEKSLLVLKNTEQNNVALKSVNESLLKENKQLEAKVARLEMGITDGPGSVDKGSSGRIESVGDNSVSAPVGMSYDEAVAMMKGSNDDTKKEDTKDEVSNSKEVKEEVPAEDKEEAKGEEDVSAEPKVKSVEFKWPELTKDELYSLMESIAKEKGYKVLPEQVNNADGKWFALGNESGRVYYSSVSNSLSFQAPDKKRYKNVDVPENLKKLGEDFIVLLIELTFTVYGLPKSFTIEKLKKHMSDEYLEGVFVRGNKD